DQVSLGIPSNIERERASGSRGAERQRVDGASGEACGVEVECLSGVTIDQSDKAAAVQGVEAEDGDLPARRRRNDDAAAVGQQVIARAELTGAGRDPCARVVEIV